MMHSPVLLEDKAAQIVRWAAREVEDVTFLYTDAFIPRLTVGCKKDVVSRKVKFCRLSLQLI